MLVVACSAPGEPAARAHVEREPIDARVVAHVAERDGLDEATARARVIETLQLVAGARAERGDPDAPELTAERRAHLRRTTLARLALREEFEPEHRAADIPDGDPMLEQARSSGRYVHPRLHDVCQLIAVPISIPAEELAQRGAELTADPAWRASAEALLEPIARHVRATVPTHDAHACDLLARDLEFEVREQGDVKIKLEHARFDLDACASERAADGSCETPSFDQDWVDAVRSGEVPGLRGPFWTRFGLHLAFVQEVLPSNMPGDDGFEQHLRAAIHKDWQIRALQGWIAGLRTEYAAQLVTSEDEAP